MTKTDPKTTIAGRLYRHRRDSCYFDLLAQDAVKIAHVGTGHDRYVFADGSAITVSSY